MTETETAGTLAGFENMSSEDFVNNIMTEVETPGSQTKATTTPAATPEATPARAPKVETAAPATPAKTEAELAAEKVLAAEAKPAIAEPTKETDLAAAQAKLDDGLKVAKTEEEKVALKTAFDTEKATIEDKYKEAPVELEFKLPEEKAAETAESDGWQELAKQQGFDIPADTFEDYTKGVEAHYKNKYEVNLGKYEPETQRFIEFLENGGTLEAFQEPLKPIQELKVLTDIELIEKDLELQKWPEDKIEKEIERLTKNEELELSAFKIRQKLDVIEENIKKDIVEQQLNTGKRKESFKQISAAEELSSFKKSLDKMSDFMEIPMKPKIKEYLVKNLESGKYADIQIKDPAIKAQFITFLEFGKDAVNLLKQKQLEQARIEYQKDKHNVPPLVSNAAAGQTKQASQTSVPEGGAGNWAALEGFNDIVNQ